MMQGTLSDTELQVSKAVANCHLILKSFGLCNWTPQHVEDLKHDIVLKRSFNDAIQIRLEIIGHEDTVIYSHTEDFHDKAQHNPAACDSAQGLEIPLIPREAIKTWRMLIPPARDQQSYASRLRLQWSAAVRLAEEAGTSFRGEHTARITGGRTSSEIFVSHQARHTGTVISVGSPATYGHVRDDLLNTDVFVHQKFLADPGALQAGVRLNYVVIQTPRGLQARDCRQIQ